MTNQTNIFPRIMISAPASGSGKTLITCGLLQALVDRNLSVGSFKAGPDFIDPMFHSKIIGAKSKNLDPFFTDERTTRFLFQKSAKNVDISVMEGAMGYYDGISPSSVAGSAYDLARMTKTPVILVIPCYGMSGSVVALIKGFLSHVEDSLIKGVILNQVSGEHFEALKSAITDQLGIRVLGYVPYDASLSLKERHLGLCLPHEIEGYKEKMMHLAQTLETTLDLNAIIELAKSAESTNFEEENSLDQPKDAVLPVRIGVALDEAFCFYYEDNLELLRDMGAELVFFSPLRDKELPKGISGLLLGGGYPELAAKRLEENEELRSAIRKELSKGMPCLAECGGFMYLHESLQDLDGVERNMVGHIQGRTYKTNRLQRFGYGTFVTLKDQLLGITGTTIKGHEFHYFESTACGESVLGKKPEKDRSWNCIQGSEVLGAGFPHLYYYSNPEVPKSFIRTCREWRDNKNE